MEPSQIVRNSNSILKGIITNESRLDSPASKIHMERLVPGMEGAGYRGHALQLNQAQRDNSLRRYNTNRRTECTAEASEIIRKSDYIHVGFGAPPMSNSEDVGRNEILPGPDDIQIHRDLSGCTLIGAPSAPSVQSQPISDESQLLPSYQAFVIKIRNLRIEARIWSGIDGFRLVTYISFQGEPPPVKGKKRVHWKCVSFSCNCTVQQLTYRTIAMWTATL